MKCPNINHPDYKTMSKAVGPARAHQLYNVNNGNFLDKTPEGNPCKIFESLKQKHGIDEAIRIKSLAFEKGTGVDLKLRDLKNMANPAILRAQMSVKAQSFVSYVAEKIQAAFPSFSVNFVVDETVKGTVHENKRGWVEKGQINYNLDRIKFDTLIHEPFHIYLWSLKDTNKEKLKELRNEAESFLSANHPIAQAVKQANPDLAYDELLDEIIVTIAGISSKHVLLNIVGPTGAIKNVDDLESVWNELDPVIGETASVTIDFYKKALKFNDFGQMSGIDFQTSRIFEVGHAFAMDVLNGNAPLSEKEELAALRTSFVTTVNQRDFQLHPPIMKSKDFFGYLKNGTNRIGALDEMNDKALVEYYLSVRTKKNTVHVGGEIIQLNGTDTNALIEEIKDKVIPRIREFQGKTRDDLKSFLNDYMVDGKFDENVEKHLKNKNGKSRYDLRVLRQLVNLIDVNSASNIMYYSELKDSNNSLLRELYDEAFEGYDPLIVVHQIKDSDGETIFDVSVVDITSMPLGHNGKNLKGRNLFSSIMSDQKAFAKGVNMNNSDGDFRKISIGMTIMSMKQKMIAKSGNSGKKNDIRFRTLGVVGLHRKNLDVRLVSDTSDLIEHVRRLRETPLMEKVENSNLNAVIGNDVLYEVDYDQSFVAMMQQYLAQTASDSNYIDKAHLKTMLEADPDTIITMLQSRQRSLESENTPEELIMNNEYTLVSGAIMELKYGFKCDRSNLRDMKFAAKWGTSTHNVRSVILQEIIRTANRASEKVYDATDSVLKEFRPGFKDYKEIYGGTARQLVHDLGSKYFEHLFKKRTVKVNTGDGVIERDVILPEIHWDMTDPETQKAISDGLITEKDVEWGKKVAELIEETYVDNIYHTNKWSRTKKHTLEVDYTRDEARQNLYEKGFRKGMIPVIRKSVNERLFDGDIKGATHQFGEQMSSIEDFFHDNLDNSNALMTSVSDRFAESSDFFKNLGKAGLDFSNGEILVDDVQANANMSTNLEKILGYFVLSSKRKQIYESEVLPLVNNANTLMTWLEGKGISQTNNKEYLKQFIERLVHTKTQDTDESLNIMGYPIMAKQAMNVGLKSIGFLAMGYRPWLGVKSHVFNELQGWITSFANGIAGNDYFGPADFLKAHNIVFTDYKKAQILADRMHLTNGQESDLVNNPFKTITDRNLGNSQYSNIANFMSDIYARRVVMVAQMLKEGSWDAYTYNEETGEVEYDETKDKRMYDDEGKITEKGQAIKNFIRKKLVEDGLQEKGNETLVRGHDYESGQLFKYLSDKYVIGSMDNKSKSMLGNHYFGRALGQFRLFSVDKFWNWGLDADSRESVFGGVIKAVKDSDGNWVAQREIIEIEGQLQSLGAAFAAIRNMKNQNVAEWWQNAGPVRRANLARLGMKVAFASMLYALIRGAFDDDDWMQQRFAWIYSDLMDASLAYETMTNPMPIVSQMQRLVEITFGDRKVDQLIKFVPGANAIKDVDDAINFIDRFQKS